jgi:hypothetical protein
MSTPIIAALVESFEEISEVPGVPNGEFSFRVNDEAYELLVSKGASTTRHLFPDCLGGPLTAAYVARLTLGPIELVAQTRALEVRVVEP